MTKHDTFCVICGNTWNRDILGDDDKIYKRFDKATKWIEKCSILLEDNTVVHGIHETGFGTDFRKGNKTYLIDSRIKNPLDIDLYRGKDNYGIFIHTDCWKYVKKYYNKKLTFGDLPIDYHISVRDDTPIKINYGPITKYWAQDFKYDEMYKDNNMWMTSSPLIHNSKNNSRIKKIISQYKFNKDKRPSPSISATFYKPGTIKIGNDNNFWIIKNNKWNKMRINTKILNYEITLKAKNDKLSKLIDNIQQIGYHSNLPLFIVKRDSKIKGSTHFYKFKFIGETNLIVKLESKLN